MIGFLGSGCSFGSDKKDRTSSRSPPATPSTETSVESGAVLYGIGLSTDPYGSSSPDGFGVATGLLGGKLRKTEVRGSDWCTFHSSWLGKGRILVPRHAVPTCGRPILFRIKPEGSSAKAGCRFRLISGTSPSPRMAASSPPSHRSPAATAARDRAGGFSWRARTARRGGRLPAGTSAAGRLTDGCSIRRASSTSSGRVTTGRSIPRAGRKSPCSRGRLSPSVPASRRRTSASHHRAGRPTVAIWLLAPRTCNGRASDRFGDRCRPRRWRNHPATPLALRDLHVRLVAARPSPRVHDQWLPRAARALRLGGLAYRAAAHLQDGAPLRLDHLVPGWPLAPP